MKLLVISILIMLAGCDSQDSAHQVWRGYASGCDRDSFAVTMDAEGDKRTFTATCKIIK